MKRAIVLVLFMLAILALGSCERMFICDEYYFDGFGFVYHHSEYWQGSGASDAQSKCNDRYASYGQCRDCR
jgi:hypothetical protein